MGEHNKTGVANVRVEKEITKYPGKTIEEVRAIVRANNLKNIKNAKNEEKTVENEND